MDLDIDTGSLILWHKFLLSLLPLERGSKKQCNPKKAAWNEKNAQTQAKKNEKKLFAFSSNDNATKSDENASIFTVILPT